MAGSKLMPGTLTPQKISLSTSSVCQSSWFIAFLTACCFSTNVGRVTCRMRCSGDRSNGFPDYWLNPLSFLPSKCVVRVCGFAPIFSLHLNVRFSIDRSRITIFSRSSGVVNNHENRNSPTICSSWICSFLVNLNEALPGPGHQCKCML